MGDIRSTYCVGNSMGAYAAIVLGARIGAHHVWAFSPATPDDGLTGSLLKAIREGSTSTRYDIWFASENPEDASVVAPLAESDQVTLHPCPGDSHWIAKTLWLSGSLPRLLDPPTERELAVEPAGELPTLEAVTDVVEDVLGARPRLDADEALTGLMDSFTSMQVLAALERRFGIALDPGDATAESMKSIAGILRALLDGARR